MAKLEWQRQPRNFLEQTTVGLGKLCSMAAIQNHKDLTSESSSVLYL